MPISKFVYVIYIRVTPEKLWQALTDPKFTHKYFYKTTHESDWKRGSSWRMKTPGGRLYNSGEVLESEPPGKLVLKWRNELKDQYRGIFAPDYHIEKSDDAVKLTVVHEIDLPDSKLIEDVAKGWPPILSSLKSLLETGEPLVKYTTVA